MTDTQTFDYQEGNTTLEGYLAFKSETKTKQPLVLVIHDWSGKNDFACNKARQLADLGYAGFAIDLYGKGILGQTKEEKSELIQPFMQNRELINRRIQAAIDASKSYDAIDQERIALIGFCFGGLCALDFARSGADARGVVSFHGLLGAPENSRNTSIPAKVLALHGYDDPMATPDQAIAFANEMTARNADWQMIMYGSTKHAFTNPDANDPDFGTVYNEKADKRSWLAMKNFLQEVLS